MPDTKAPVLTSLSFTPVVNVGSGLKPITVTAGATDDLAGVREVDVYFTSTLNVGYPGSPITFVAAYLGVYGSFDSFSDGQSAYTTWITPFNAPGTYTVDHVDVIDEVNNKQTYDASQLAALGAQTSFVIQGGTADTTAPTLTSLSFTPMVDVGSGAKPVTFTVGATDDLSGVGFVQIYFTSPINSADPGSSAASSSSSFLAYGSSPATYMITPFNAPGTYTIDHVDVHDQANNTHTYSASQLTALGAQTSFVVQGGVADMTAPTLTSLSFTPVMNVGTGAKPMTIVAGATDDLIGVQAVTIFFTSPISYGFPNGSPGLVIGNNLGVSDAVDSFSDGTSAATYTITRLNAPGTYTIDYVWVVDAAQNTRTYSASELAALGMQTSFVIEDVNAPPLITANGGGDTASLSVPENTTAVSVVTATDPDAGTTLTYSIAGGADAGRFHIDGASGALSFITAPDFEAPADVDHDNTYIVQVRASDGVLSDDQVLTVNVSNQLDTVPPSDFYGNHRSGVLWQNDNGQLGLWGMNGLNAPSMANPGFNPGAAWHVIGAGDFDGDGKGDILWQNADGTPAAWLMNGTTVLSGANVGFNPGPSWHAIAAADFNGDGKADILWQNSNGQAAVWQMDGLNVVSGTNVGVNVGAAWHVIGAGDFDGDGKADILWQNSNGQAAIWLMDGFNVKSGSDVGLNPGSAWHVQGAGDFNGDGKADILWQNADGTPAVWLMNGLNLVSGANVGFNPGPAWQVHGSGDFNGDGKADIAWQNTDGTLAAWLMDGFNVVAGSNIGLHLDATWHVIPQHHDLLG
jgi:FG-GAP-like repeat/Cadherin domain